MKITVSVIKADVGGIGGHTRRSDGLIEAVRETVKTAGDLLKDSFSGNVKGMGPGVAELEFEERPNEAFTVFAADKTEPGCFNYPMYRLFVDSLSNTGLIVNKSLAKGVIFYVMDV